MNYADLNNVLKFEKLELGITLPADILEKVNNFVNNAEVGAEDKLNPYLDWKTRVYAEFTPVDVTAPFVIDGFYTKEFTPWMVTTLPPLSPGQERYSEAEYEALGGYTENPTDYPFRVRFAPNKVGKWKALVKIEVNGILVHTSSVFEFNVIESGNPGYVRVGINKRYLRREGTFYPLGCNLNWPETDSIRDFDLAEKLVTYNPEGEKKTVSEGYMHKVAKPRVYDKYRDYMNLLADGGANYYRSIMYPASTELEWEHLGDYTKRLSMAQEMDSIVNTAKARDLFIHWNMQIHYSFQYSQNAYDRYWCWQSGMISEGTIHNFAYRSVVESNEPVDFLIDDDAKKYYKQRLRYILARWGYSTNVAVWELFSEISNVGASAADNSGFYMTDTNWVRYRDWQVEMADYLKTMYHGQCHLLTASYGGEKHEDDNTFESSSMDIMTSNVYDFEEPNFGDFWINSVAKKYLNESDNSINSYSRNNVKPLIFSETDPIATNCDELRVDIRRSIWQAPFSGLAGALSWEMQWSPEYFDNYGKIRNFIADIDFDTEQWHSGATVLGSPNSYFFNSDYAKDMDGKVIPLIDCCIKRERKADLSYLRSGDANFAVGVITNKTYNIETVSGCLNDDYWSESYQTNLYPAQLVSFQNEKLKLNGLFNSKYYINYFNLSDVNNPMSSSDDQGLKIKIEGSSFPNETNYITLFKARRENFSWINSTDEINEESFIDKTLQERDYNLFVDTVILFPNPFTSNITLKLRFKSNLDYSIRTIDGKEILFGSITSDVTNINVEELVSGLYIIELRGNKKLVYFNKIIKL
jgi:hypothetical protein